MRPQDPAACSQSAGRETCGDVARSLEQYWWLDDPVSRATKVGEKFGLVGLVGLVEPAVLYTVRHPKFWVH
mgnify:FL=1